MSAPKFAPPPYAHRLVRVVEQLQSEFPTVSRATLAACVESARRQAAATTSDYPEYAALVETTARHELSRLVMLERL